jgi:hypothetical protein
MIWVGWRQQRTETAIAALALALFAAVAIPGGIHMASVYSRDRLASCTGTTTPGTCTDAIASFAMRFNGLNILLTWSTLLPAIAALLLAAPFVLDLERGTYRLAWTQSITRRRWIATKLGLGVAAAVLVALLLTVLVTWSRAPLDHLNGRMDANTYDAEGVVPIAYALLVLGVAVAIGALWRRAVPALVLAFVGYVVLRSLMDSWLRKHLIGPVTRTWAFGSPGPRLDRALVVDQFPSDAHGHRIAGAARLCVQSPGIERLHSETCASPAPIRGFITAVYEPAGRFWALQGLEFAVVGGAGILLVLAAAWWTARRLQ